MEIHLDPLGGWAGDMFAAALLDAFPEFWPDVEAAVRSLDLGPQSACRLVEHGDGVLTGRRFLVVAENAQAGESHRPHAGQHSHDHLPHAHASHGHSDHAEPPGQHTGGHGHRAWVDIEALLHASRLDAGVKHHAVAIFGLLAEAEAAVHGVAVGEVMFHEVGAVDSIVDIVAAATLIRLSGATAWSSSPLPLGSGRVRTAHGLLPVPTPATALLLRGLPTLDDGIAGERITPTGAAIARHLLAGVETRRPSPRRLVRTGTGFGTRRLPGTSNCLRILAFEPSASAGPRAPGTFAHRELGVVTFEVDDQSGEDLAAGLDHIRALPGVHDVLQSVAFGKKGRMATHVQVLVAPEALDAAVAACFEETTTIGLRYHVVQGATLARGFDEVEVEGRPLRVKAVERPDGLRTAKTEASDVAAARGHATRVRLRRAAEDEVLGRRASRNDEEEGKR